jgi:hypothetical protein
VSWASTVAAIRAHFSAEWSGALAAVHPENASAPPDPGAASLVLSILPGERQQTNLGKKSRWHQTPGLLDHQLYLPAGSGTSLAHEIADEIEAVWIAAEIAGVKLYETQRPTILGQQGPWLRANVSTRFLIHDQVTVPEVAVRLLTDLFPGHGIVAAPAAFAWSSGLPVPVTLTASSTGAVGVVTRIDPDNSNRLTLALDGQAITVLAGHGLGAVGPRWINASGTLVSSEPSGLKQLVLEVLSPTRYHVRIGAVYA